MAHLNYEYIKKKETDDRKDFQAIFMVNQFEWQRFKKICKDENLKPSEMLRRFVKQKINQ